MLMFCQTIKDYLNFIIMLCLINNVSLLMYIINLSCSSKNRYKNNTDNDNHQH